MGFNVDPKEVAKILRSHPKVALAAVIGLPDPRSGEKQFLYSVSYLGAQSTMRGFFDISLARSSTLPYVMHLAMQCLTQAG